MNDQLLKKYQTSASQTELGKQSQYDSSYNPDRLYAIPRAGKRKEIGVEILTGLLFPVLIVGTIMKCPGLIKKGSLWWPLLNYFMTAIHLILLSQNR